MDYSAILDFGDNPVTDVDTKLKILKFNYSWVDAVEEEERRVEEEQKQKIEKKKLEKEILEKKNDNTHDIRVATPLDFGHEAVKNWETKLQILKFSYSWADQVEKEEKAAIQEAKPAEKRVPKEENETNNRSFGKTLTKDEANFLLEGNKNSPRGRLKAFIRKRKEEEAKACINEENKTKTSRNGGTLIKDRAIAKKSPRGKLTAFIKKRKERELAKALIERENIKKVQAADSTKQKDAVNTKKALDQEAFGDEKESLVPETPTDVKKDSHTPEELLMDETIASPIADTEVLEVNKDQKIISLEVFKTQHSRVFADEL
ncbi:splicing regulatory glutamine/lysine-rich protein 1-like [Saccostrea cucullata]|uniref:splicing regulatory glutamine/lysine-rich protein 1-like n=1 Tax=Saccostrea cuccullata TaxID=36930 RepID=UPI002ED561F8